MFKTENAHLVPNRLAAMAEEHQPLPHPTLLLKDTTNTRTRPCRFDKVPKCRGDQQSLPYLGVQNESKSTTKQAPESNHNDPTNTSKLKNLLINFDSQEESHSDHENIENQPHKQNYSLVDLSLAPEEIPSKALPTTKEISSKKKTCLLLDIDSEDEGELIEEDQLPELPPTQHQPQLTNTEQKIQPPSTDPILVRPNTKQEEKQQVDPTPTYAQTDTKPQQQPIQQLPQIQQQQILSPEVQRKKQFLLQLQHEDEPSELQEKLQEVNSISSKQASLNKKMIIRLAGMLARFGNNYHLEPIPYGAVFQCVVKRDRCESLLRYHLYDCVSLRKFITVIKDEQGYLIVSNQLDKAKAGTTEEKDYVIGRVVSNFFGTEFNCLLENSQYMRGCKYPANQKSQKIITIEYETNILGLKGPRRISAYIPTQSQKKYENLNKIYQKQAKKKLKPSILKFKNKTPKWCRQINAYVLNFSGRATVSSIKNFIMVPQNEQQEATDAVVFGKCGREIFNLDVRYPFSIMQAVSLALSSFDRKLACQ